MQEPPELIVQRGELLAPFGHTPGAQACGLHDCEVAPEHTDPPFRGAGLLQARVWVPPPQDALHPLQAPHPPLTEVAHLVPSQPEPDAQIVVIGLEEEDL